MAFTLEDINKFAENKFAENIANEENGSFETDERVYQIKDATKNNTIHGKFVPWKADGIPYVKGSIHTIAYLSAGETKKFRHFCLYDLYKKSCPTCSPASKSYKEEFATHDLFDYWKSLRKKKTIFVNFYVIQDQENPENNGKVFILPLNNSKTYGQVFMKAVNPSDEKKKALGYVDPDLFNIKNSADVYVNFESSKVTGEQWNNWSLDIKERKSPIAETDQDIINILNRTHDIDEWIKEANHFGAKLKTAGEINEILSKATDQQSNGTFEDEYGNGDESEDSNITESFMRDGDVSDGTEEDKNESPEVSDDDLDALLD